MRDAVAVTIERLPELRCGSRHHREAQQPEDPGHRLQRIPRELNFQRPDATGGARRPFKDVPALNLRRHPHNSGTKGTIMCTDRLTATTAVTQKPKRLFSIHWTGVGILAALVAAPAYVAQTGFAQDLIAQASTGLQVRELIGRHRSSTSWRVECVSDYDPYWEAREIANRVESGVRVFAGRLQVRIVSN
jgi:hypothetical protein